jgi:hypothetical protein
VVDGGAGRRAVRGDAVTPLELRLAEDLLDLAQLKRDIRQAVGAPRVDGQEPADPLEALPCYYSVLLRQVTGTARPFES